MTPGSNFVRRLALAWCRSVGTTVREMLTPDGNFVAFAEFVRAVCDGGEVPLPTKAEWRDGLWAAQCEQERVYAS